VFLFFSHDFLPVAYQRGKQVADDATRARPDPDRNGHAGHMQLLSSSVLLDICAGSLEFVQLWIPGRTAGAGDFATSTIGAWIGLLIIVVVRRAHERKIIVSYK